MTPDKVKAIEYMVKCGFLIDSHNAAELLRMLNNQREQIIELKQKVCNYEDALKDIIVTHEQKERETILEMEKIAYTALGIN